MAAAFLLAACEPVGSSRGPSKEQAVKQLQTATKNLQTAIKNEVEAQIKYFETKGSQASMLRLLRRIVVLGHKLESGTPRAKWEHAKEDVNSERKKIKQAIATLRGAGGGVEAAKAQKNIDKVMKALDEVRNLPTLAEVKAAGASVEEFMKAAVKAMSNLLSSGALLYAVGNSDDYNNWKWNIITANGNTEPFDVKKIDSIFGEFRTIVGLKEYWLSTKEGKVSLLRRSDATKIPVKTTHLPESWGALFIEIIMCITEFRVRIRILKSDPPLLSPKSTGLGFRQAPLRNFCTTAQAPRQTSLWIIRAICY